MGVLGTFLLPLADCDLVAVGAEALDGCDAATCGVDVEMVGNASPF